MADRAEGEERADVARRLDRGETGPADADRAHVVRDRLPDEDPDGRIDADDDPD